MCKLLSRKDVQTADVQIAENNVNCAESKITIFETVTSDLFEENKEFEQQLYEATNKVESQQLNMLETIKKPTSFRRIS